MRATRGATGPLIVALLLAGSRQVVGSQSPSGAVLVDVPIPRYPPLAQSVLMSGDVRVTVDVRQDGTVASAAVASVEDNTGRSNGFLEKPALEAARNARFRCEECGDGTRPYSLVFAFRFAERIGRQPGHVDPEITSISPSESRILIVAEMPEISDGPAATRPPARMAKCLWLWRCEGSGRSGDDDVVGPELRLLDLRVPAYPAEGHASMASADVEVRIAVQRDGRVLSADIGTTRDLGGFTPEIQSAFQAAALAASREARFLCLHCNRRSLPYSIEYRFRFDGVLTSLEPGNPFAGMFMASSTQAIVPVKADVTVLEPALNFRADALPSMCRLAPAEPAEADLPVAGNPWGTSDQPTMSRIRARVTGHPDAARYELQLVEGVRQAYVARYIDGNGGTSVVSGLLFGDTNDAKAFVDLATKPGSTTFLAHRKIVVAVHGNNACADALADRLRMRAE